MIFQGYSTCRPVNPRGLIQTSPFLGGAGPHALAVDSGFFLIFIISSGGYEATPLQVARVPLLVGRSILHQRGRQILSFLLTWGLLIHFTPPVLCLAFPTMTQFCDWLHSSWGSLSTSINGHQHNSLCLTFMLLPRSAATSHYLRSSPVLSVCSSRCPQQKLQFPFFHTRKALLVGCWVTALPHSSYDILFLSPLTEVVLCGVGLVQLFCVWQLPIHKGMSISDATRRSRFQWRTSDFPCWFITS